MKFDVHKIPVVKNSVSLLFIFNWQSSEGSWNDRIVYIRMEFELNDYRMQFCFLKAPWDESNDSLTPDQSRVFLQVKKGLTS